MSASDIKEAMKSPLVRGQYLAAIRNRGKDVLLNNMAEAMDLLIAMAAEKEAAERERDELRDEIARRDAAAGEPVSTQLVYSSVLPKFIGDTDEIESYSCFISGETPPRKTMTEAYADAKQVCGELYTAALPVALAELEQDVKNIIGLLSENEWAEHCTKSELGRKLENEITELHNTYSRAPAVLPPDITFESKGFVSLTSEDFAYNRALEDARKLGSQTQKSVICPPVQYLPKYAADDGHCTTGKLVPNKRTELRDTEWREALDAAGVKWEVKNSDG